MSQYSQDFDWNTYWNLEPPSKELIQGGKRMALRLRRLIKTRHIAVKSLGDVGCGPAVMLFDLARIMPQCRFRGYDKSSRVIEANQNQTRRERLTNLHFTCADLPHIPVIPKFDIVTCMATLHYLRDPLQALRNLYEMVQEGGYLIFNYPNQLQRAAYRRETANDPTLKRRFQLVLSGVNLLSVSTIQQAIHQQPQNFWTAIGEPTLRANPCVLIAKRTSNLLH